MAESRDRAQGRLLLAAFGCVAFVVWALVAEIIASANANSPVAGWTEYVFSLAWPEPLRVLWWLAVAAAAFGFRAAMHGLGFRQRPVVVAISVLPFLAFAFGVAIGADWATWH